MKGPYCFLTKSVNKKVVNTTTKNVSAWKVTEDKILQKTKILLGMLAFVSSTKQESSGGG